MRMQTGEMSGPALRYAVCLALGFKIQPETNDHGCLWVERPDGSKGWVDFRADCQGVEFDTDWDLAGPLIQREGLDLCPYDLVGIPEGWRSHQRGAYETCQWGADPRVAAMRCFVKSKFGHELDVPRTLLPRSHAGTARVTPVPAPLLPDPERSALAAPLPAGSFERVNTLDLSGSALRFAMCIALGFRVSPEMKAHGLWVVRPDGNAGFVDFAAECQGVEFDSSWKLTGPVIERAPIDLCVSWDRKGEWSSRVTRPPTREQMPLVYGTTPLLAVARAVVFHQLGPWVGVPKSLLAAKSDPTPVASWVVREIATRKVLFETYDSRKVAALNTAKYEAVPIGTYLGEFNRIAREHGAEVANAWSHGEPITGRESLVAGDKLALVQTPDEKTAPPQMRRPRM